MFCRMVISGDSVECDPHHPCRLLVLRSTSFLPLDFYRVTTSGTCSHSDASPPTYVYCGQSQHTRPIMWYDHTDTDMMKARINMFKTFPNYYYCGWKERDPRLTTSVQTMLRCSPPFPSRPIFYYSSLDHMARCLVYLVRRWRRGLLRITSACNRLLCVRSNSLHFDLATSQSSSVILSFLQSSLELDISFVQSLFVVRRSSLLAELSTVVTRSLFSFLLVCILWVNIRFTLLVIYNHLDNHNLPS